MRHQCYCIAKDPQAFEEKKRERIMLRSGPHGWGEVVRYTLAGLDPQFFTFMSVIYESFITLSIILELCPPTVFRLLSYRQEISPTHARSHQERGLVCSLGEHLDSHVSMGTRVTSSGEAWVHQSGWKKFVVEDQEKVELNQWKYLGIGGKTKGEEDLHCFEEAKKRQKYRVLSTVGRTSR